MGLKSLIISIAFIGFVSASGFASCEDGESMAADAAVKYVQHFIPGLNTCSTLSTSLLEGGAGEAYSVTLSCKTLDYKKAQVHFIVNLKEVEDATCYVKDVIFKGSI